MNRYVLGFVLLAFASRAGAQADQQPSGGAADPMAGWKPPVVKSERKDRQEIQAFLKKMEDVGKKGDLDAAAALIDFPVMMITDDSKGQASGEAWDREKWVQTMTPFYRNAPKDMKVTHKPTIFVVTDSLATVDDAWTMTMGGKKTSGRSGMLLVRIDGEWRTKAMMEGGWGDMPMGEPGATPGSQTPGSPSK
jgi:hypothetical protein